VINTVLVSCAECVYETRFHIRLSGKFTLFGELEMSTRSGLGIAVNNPSYIYIAKCPRRRLYLGPSHRTQKICYPHFHIHPLGPLASLISRFSFSSDTYALKLGVLDFVALFKHTDFCCSALQLSSDFLKA